MSPRCPIERTEVTSKSEFQSVTKWLFGHSCLIDLSTTTDIGEDTLTRRRRAAQNQTSPPFRIVLIEDDPCIVRLLEKILDEQNMKITACSTGAVGLEVLDREEWDLCLLDRGLPDFDGIEICRYIKADARFDARQVIMLSGYSSLEARVEALNLGADDYITKPFHPIELLARVKASRRVVEMQQQLVDMARQLEELSARDGLTGIFNRRHFGATLDRAFEHSTRYSRPLSVAIIDVDCFKSINDSFGRSARNCARGGVGAGADRRGSHAAGDGERRSGESHTHALQLLIRNDRRGRSGALPCEAKRAESGGGRAAALPAAGRD